jgi:hypothetical protein
MKRSRQTSPLLPRILSIASNPAITEHWSTTGGSSLSYAARALWHTRASARLTPSRHLGHPAFGSADGKAVMGDRWASRLLEWRAGVGRVVTAEISAARYSVRADQHEALAWAEVSLAVGAGSRSGVSQLWRRLVRLRSGMRTCGAGGMGIRGQMSRYRNAACERSDRWAAGAEKGRERPGIGWGRWIWRLRCLRV